MADPATSAPSLSDTEATRPTPRAKGGRVIAWFCLLLILAGAAVGVWAWQQNRAEDASLRHTLSQLEQQLNAAIYQRQQLEVALQQVQQLASTAVEQQQRTDRHLEQLNTQYEVLVAQMQTLDGRRSADWLVAEADYLVRMAGRKIWLDRDLRTAMMLLGNADERLAQVADPAVLAARTAIAEDLQMLSQLNPVSRTSLALSLRGLYTQIDSLPLHELPVDHPSDKPQQTDKMTDWRHNLSVIWQGILDTFIRVSWQETPVTPLLSAQSKWMVREQLKLSLVSAQHAALQAQTVLYEQSLATAKELINAHFSTTDHAVQAIQTGLDQLMRTDVSQPLPTELAAQKHMEQLMDKRVARVFGVGAATL